MITFINFSKQCKYYVVLQPNQLIASLFRMQRFFSITVSHADANKSDALPISIYHKSLAISGYFLSKQLAV